MTDKEKILAKIESLLNEANYEPYTDETLGKIQSLKELKSYIDSMPEELESEDLEEAAKNHAAERYRTTRSEFLAIKCKWSFITGAKWDKEQMMKNALSVIISNNWGHPEFKIEHFMLEPLGIKSGDKVKMIILKDE